MPVASADALTGLGLPVQLANLLGGNPSQLTCVGTAQSGAAVIKSKNTELVAVTSQTACIFPTDAGVMEPYNIVNPAAAATTALVFVPSGHTVAGSLNGSVSISQNKSAIIWQYKPKFWAAVVSA